MEWYTATESSNDYFTVYRTINGIDWESVGIVSGGGTTQYKQRYLLDDRGFNKGMINYYRLSQTDTDGNIEFIGKIIQIDNRFSNQKIVKSYNIMGQEILPDSKGVVMLPQLKKLKIDPSNYIIPLLHFIIGIVNKAWTSLLLFFDEFVENISSHEA